MRRILLVATIFSLALARESGAQSWRKGETVYSLQVADTGVPLSSRSLSVANHNAHKSFKWPITRRRVFGPHSPLIETTTIRKIPGSARASTWMVAMRKDFTHAIPAGL